MKYLYDVIENEEFGHLGLKIRTMPNAEPHGPLTAVHDLFEHFPGMIDTDGEAMALGAMLYCRGEGGFFNHSVSDVISSDLAGLFLEEYQWGSLTDPGRTTPLEDYLEVWITSGISKAMIEIMDCGQTIYCGWPNWIRGWLRKGYRRARIRYEASPSYISHVFREMMGEMEVCLKHAEEYDLIEVNFVRKTLRYNIRHISRWDSDHPDFEPWED